MTAAVRQSDQFDFTGRTATGQDCTVTPSNGKGQEPHVSKWQQWIHRFKLNIERPFDTRGEVYKISKNKKIKKKNVSPPQ